MTQQIHAINSVYTYDAIRSLALHDRTLTPHSGLTNWDSGGTRGVVLA